MKSLKTLWLAGALLTILGSFLPWEQAGDLFSYWTYGIQLSPTVSDNGGVLVVLLTFMIILLTFQPSKFIKNPGLWKLVISVLLMAASLLLVGRWLIRRFESAGVTGAPTLEIGLIGVVVGSALLMCMTLIEYRKIINRQTNATNFS